MGGRVGIVPMHVLEGDLRGKAARGVVGRIVEGVEHTLDARGAQRLGVQIVAPSSILASFQAPGDRVERSAAAFSRSITISDWG